VVLDIHGIRSPQTQTEVVWKLSSHSAFWQSSSTPSTAPANARAAVRPTALVAGMDDGKGVAAAIDERTPHSNAISPDTRTKETPL